MTKRTAHLILLILTLTFGWTSAAGVAAAADASQAFFAAEACYGHLKKDPARMRLRHHWQRCIGQFERAYEKDTAGPWAPASLYMTGILYRELARRSGSDADRRQAVERFEKVIERFPDSRYRGRSIAVLAKMGAAYKPTARKPEPDAPAHRISSPKDSYFEAEACYRRLRENTSLQKYRHNWLKCIRKYEAVHRQDPDGPWAAAGLFMEGRLYQELHRWSKNDDDAAAARKAYDKIIAEFHQSRYRSRAQKQIDAHPELRRTVRPEPEPDAVAGIIESSRQPAAEAERQASPPTAPATAEGPVTVENLRFWSNPSYTRVVIDADQETGFNHRLLKKDPSLGKPQRLYVDLENSRLGKNIQRTIPINDDLLIDARAGQYSRESVRVVVDIKSFDTYKIFSLRDPFRIVIDVWGRNGRSDHARTDGERGGIRPGGGKLPSGALARQLALGVSRIVIDPGHGGKDFGAPGYLKGVHEKHIVLKIAQRLAEKLKAELGCEVILTRSGDRYLTLEERTAFANTQNADLFISLHTNANRDRRANGIETYFLNLATDDEAIRVAAMENATSQKNISDLQTILNDLMQNAKINESSRLAGHVQTSLIAHLERAGYKRIRDKGVKQAPFYVLLGARMPAILIEAAFISNPTECKRLVNPRFQERLASAVAAGVKKYIEATLPTAFRQRSPLTKSAEGDSVALRKSDS